MSAESPFQDNIVLKLQKFTHATWGNSDRVLVRHPDFDGEYIDLGEYFEAFRVLFPTAVFHDKILVRREYRDALQALKGTKYSGGAYVTGQPGIGKTIFLICVLIVSLKERRPVALELPDGRPFYALFQQSGFSIHSFLGGLIPIIDLPNFMWVLSDSNFNTKPPNPIFFSTPNKIRVIQATSPREERWKRWSEEVGASCYIMDIWTLEEIERLANLLRLDINHMKSLGEKWGCNPRYLLNFIKRGQTDLEIERTYRSQAPMAVERSKDMLSSIRQNALFINAPSKFYFCRPMHISETEIDRAIPVAVVPTQTICEVLGDALKEHDINVRLTFFRALSQHNETRSAAGYIYEHLFHTYFATGEPIRCHWTKVWRMGSSSVIRLTNTSNFTASTWRALNRDAPFFWIAPKGTAGIDSVLVLEKVIYVFQVTISPEHVSPINGMTKVRQYLPSKSRDVTWKVVFVGQESATAKAVADHWAKELSFPPKSNITVPIAWAEVDPVVKGVHLVKGSHHEQDLELDVDDGEEVEPAEQGSSSKGKKRAIQEVVEPNEASEKASTSRTRFGTRKKHDEAPEASTSDRTTRSGTRKKHDARDE